MKAKYHAAKLLRLVTSEVKDFAEQRNALVKELGESRDPTAEERKHGQVEPVHQVTDANLATFAERMRELADVPVTLSWGPIDLATLNETTVTALEIGVLLDAGLAVMPDDPA